MTGLIVDTSVWSTSSTDAVARGELERLISSVPSRRVLLCPPIAAELGFSARSGAEHSILRNKLEAFPECELSPSVDDALAIQNALWNAGLVREVGAMDVLIAAYALRNEATVIHLDRDFEHVASVIPQFSQRWLISRERRAR